MSDRYDCSDPGQRAAGLKAAHAAVSRGELVVLPTDTVYGIGADAFTPVAVAGLLAAKRRGRDMPPPVLVGSVLAATALVDNMSETGRDFIDEFWPGGLTLVCRARPTLSWDLGRTKGTVAIRMPSHQLALELLKETGPLAVSSANISGSPPAATIDEAIEQFGDSVAVYLDGGRSTSDVPSTIIDLTGIMPRLLREGAISLDQLYAVAAVAPVSTAPPPEDDEDESDDDEDDEYEDDDDESDEDDDESDDEEDDEYEDDEEESEDDEDEPDDDEDDEYEDDDESDDDESDEDDDESDEDDDESDEDDDESDDDEYEDEDDD